MSEAPTPFLIWPSFGCACGGHWWPITFNSETAVHDSKHIFDQYWAAHILWGWLLVFLYPETRGWYLFLALFLYEFIEVVEFHLGIYGDSGLHVYSGDSFLNSFCDAVFVDSIAILTGKLLLDKSGLGRRACFGLYLFFDLAPQVCAELECWLEDRFEFGRSAKVEIGKNRFWNLEGGPHAYFFGHWQKICDLREVGEDGTWKGKDCLVKEYLPRVFVIAVLPRLLWAFFRWCSQLWSSETSRREKGKGRARANKKQV
uniref:Uncharacterized protein n=1 Tax=Chromera velia CCMP2878 TaxID=1169474 RepID=A0A0G4GI90_9ALVE|eukprot:Cvel_22030.t1-p1 / transcript=Cvel_22030.t1 / gene=Cvel_22030 / organism=Chromera_velia_CCMP2878 / gene_product=hypothetical protein / transcript_product=hypothetical protein / location=Cvel_scaffold2126:9065-9835(+) / protein_length=257 / sequence_SO=supercontig / SO=protein_coding / is_pseudo=false